MEQTAKENKYTASTGLLLSTKDTPWKLKGHFGNVSKTLTNSKHKADHAENEAQYLITRVEQQQKPKA